MAVELNLNEQAVHQIVEDFFFFNKSPEHTDTHEFSKFNELSASKHFVNLSVNCEHTKKKK